MAIKIGFLLVLALVNLSTSYAQSADELATKFSEKAGGKEKWKAVKSMTIIGTQRINGMEVPLVITLKSPNLLKIEANVQGQTLIQCFDGKKAWTSNPLTGSGKPETMSDEQSKEFSKRAFIMPDLIDYTAAGGKLTSAGKETIGGTAYDKITLTKKDVSTQTFLLDPITGLVYMMKSTLTEGQFKGKVMETKMSDYRDEQGLKVAHTTEIKMGDQTVGTIAYSSVKINDPVDDKIFQMPAAAK